MHNASREISALYGQIGEIGMGKIVTDIDMMGKSYKEVSADIRAATAASNGSISSLEKQRSVWIQLRNGLDPASDAFKEVTRDIERVDRALEKTSRTRRKFSPGKAAQVAGATISGGIFGGPEGFLGGAIGGAVGATELVDPFAACKIWYRLIVLENLLYFQWAVLDEVAACNVWCRTTRLIAREGSRIGAGIPNHGLDAREVLHPFDGWLAG